MRYLSLVLLATMFLGPHPAPHWQVVPSASIVTYANDLRSVSAVSPHTIWAVGETWLPNGTLHPIAERCNEHACQIVPTPNVGATYSALDVVAAIPGTAHVWAAGYTWNGGVASSFFEYYNGTRWKVVPSPTFPEAFTYFSALVALSEQNAWAVGVMGPRNNQGQVLIEHWNGRSWKVVPSPSTDKLDNQLSSVSALSPDDIWAAGYSQRSMYSPMMPLVEHYNGHEWRIVPTGLDSGSLGAVLTFSDHNIWATYGHSSNFARMAHFDGTAWHAVNLPIALYQIPYLYGTAGVAGQVWVVGSNLDAGTLIYHYDEGHWSVRDTPWQCCELDGVVALSANNVWAVGATQDNSGRLITLVERYH